MKVRITVTICFGIMIALCGLSPAAQDDAVQSGVLQKTKTAESSLRQEPVPVDQKYHSLRKQLMLKRIESVADSSGQTQTDILGDLISQLHSLEISPKLTPEEPNEAVLSLTDAVAAPQLLEESRTSEKSVETAAGDEFVVILGKMDNAISPLQLADVLYRQGYYELAFENYSRVDRRLSEDRITDRQWILFQKGNCCRHSDPSEAIGFYNELIESFPNSRWTAAASSRLKMIGWGQLNQITDLVENRTDDTNNQ